MLLALLFAIGGFWFAVTCAWQGRGGERRPDKGEDYLRREQEAWAKDHNAGLAYMGGYEVDREPVWDAARRKS